MKNIFNLVSNLNKSFGGVSFINVRKYSSKSKQFSTLQDIKVNVGANPRKAKEHDANLLKALTSEQLEQTLKVVRMFDKRVTIETMQEARTAMVKSMLNPDKVRSEAQLNAGDSISANGSLKFYSETGMLNIEGLVVSRSNFEVVDKAVYEAVMLKEANVKSRALTVAKNAVETLINRKYNPIRLTVSQSQAVALQGDVLEFDYSLKQK